LHLFLDFFKIPSSGKVANVFIKCLHVQMHVYMYMQQHNVMYMYVAVSELYCQLTNECMLDSNMSNFCSHLWQ